MRRRAKPAKASVKGKRPPARQSLKNEASRVRDLEKRLAESLKRERAKDRALVEALEQQTATSELLKVIGRATFDLQLVLQTLAENAVRLCKAEQVTIFRFDGQLFQAVVTHNLTPAQREFVEQNPIAPGRHSGAGRAALERRTIHIHDVRTDPEYTYGDRPLPLRTLLAIPMLRADELLGTISIQRDEVRPFTDSQIALMETFADQAAIAIENVRLFNETREALDQQTATSEILRVISSSPTTLDPVLQAVVKTAARLCEASNASLYRVEGELMRKVAGHGSVRTTLEVGDTRPITRGSVTARAMMEGRTLHIADLLAEVDTEDPWGRDNVRREGVRTFVATPLLREGVPIGVISVYRTEVRPFSDKQIELLKTFADQAVIAIENVRLFKELEARNGELTTALDRQTATADVLRIIA